MQKKSLPLYKLDILLILYKKSKSMLPSSLLNFAVKDNKKCKICHKFDAAKKGPFKKYITRILVFNIPSAMFL